MVGERHGLVRHFIVFGGVVEAQEVTVAVRATLHLNDDGRALTEMPGHAEEVNRFARTGRFGTVGDTVSVAVLTGVDACQLQCFQRIRHSGKGDAYFVEWYGGRGRFYVLPASVADDVESQHAACSGASYFYAGIIYGERCP